VAYLSALRVSTLVNPVAAQESYPGREEVRRLWASEYFVGQLELHFPTG
jgi:hypothetical protein